MDTLVWMALGAVVLVSVSMLGGLIIRKTQRMQKGGPFYVSLVCIYLALVYGVVPLFAPQGVERAAAYGVSVAVSILVSQWLLGEKQKPNA